MDHSQIKQRDYVSQTLLACPIDSPVDLQLLAGMKTYRLPTKLIGIDNHHALILRYGKGEEWSEAESYLKSGQPIVARILNETGFCQVLAFRTEVEATIATPRKLLCIMYPHSLEMAKLRQTTRVRLQEECQLRWETEEPPAPVNKRAAELLDLSATGCRIAAKLPTPLPKGCQIELHSESWQSKHLLGTVRNFKRGESGLIHLGIEFTANTSAMESLIGQLMLRQLREHDTASAML